MLTADSPEEGVSIEILTLLIFSVAYYGAFVLVQGGLSRLCKQILEPHYFLPAALAAGMGVGFVFISGLDFLFWLLYQKDMGTIFISALVLEIIFLMMNLGIVWRTANTDKLSFQRVRMTILLLVTAVALVVLAIPLLFE